MKKKDRAYFQGCLLGGAIGDALGAPIEFLSSESIKIRVGKNGIENYVFGKDKKAEITDDTQMTMFTAEGLLRAQSRYNTKGICHPPSVVFYAYLRWLHTQRINTLNKNFNKKELDGWLIGVKELYALRAPGNTCITALKNGIMGAVDDPINNSKGCGGVMRIAPVGLIVKKGLVFDYACEIAALTHGHPSGYLSAGVLAMIIYNIIMGMPLVEAIEDSIDILKTKNNHEECLKVIQYAIELSKNSSSHQKNIEKIGGGWVGEEAIAIAIYCSLISQNDFKKGVIAAVNHSGDSDSTGAITGNILGAYLGISSIPHHWIQNLELAEELEILADDLLNVYQDTKEWWNKYPGK